MGHFGDESFQAIDCSGADNQIQWNKTLHTSGTQKKQTKKPALPNKTNEALFRYIFTTSGQEMARALLVFL